MELITKIPISKSNHPLDYNSRIVSFGSCFVENMGGKFEYYKFQNITNPFGILFQPLAIEKLIAFAISEKEFTTNDVFFHNERWHCFDAHSALSHPQKEVLLKNLNNVLQLTSQNLKQATHCIITLGTAWVYQHKTSGELVANCHKVPQKEFEKRLLTVDEIEKSLKNIIGSVRKLNPDCSLIFTISPVRHLKDGFTENQVSKSHLISALYKTRNAEEFKQDLYYFPSYEIVMDELRDYRFYAPDMIHPNPTAIDYIWNRFSEYCISEEAFLVMKEVGGIQKGMAHKPFNPDSESHISFLNDLQEKIQSLQKRFSHIDFYK
tara:strand:+ start:52502 stop:53464 length:963 start_codon:yes stop_codon:yes gene_type:complete